MATLAQKQLRQTRADMERDLKRRDREKLLRLRIAIQAATQAKRERVRGVRALCKAEEQRLKQRAALARQRLRESIQRMRERAKGLCAVNVADTRHATGEAIAKAVAELQSERGYQAGLKAWTRPTSCALPRGQKAREARGESDCEVAANIEDAGLRAVWERVKHRVKASPRSTRTETFLHWAHDHPGDVEQIQYQEEEKAVRQLIKQEHKMRQALNRPQRYSKKSPEELAELLRDVPF